MSRDPYRDQAARLKKKIERVQDEPPVKKREPLPPRSELHREKHKKSKWKVKYPLISMLLLFFILLPLTVFSIYSYFDSRNGPLVVLSEGADDVVEVRYDPSENEGEESEEVADSNVKKPSSSNNQEEDTPKETPSSTEKKQQASLPAVTPPTKETVEEKPKEEVKEEPKEEVQEEPKVKIVYHTVKPKETLFRIAMNYYNSPSGVDRIKEWNKIQDNEIQTGQVLEIPLDQ